jgi:hypothetical protein
VALAARQNGQFVWEHLDNNPVYQSNTEKLKIQALTAHNKMVILSLEDVGWIWTPIRGKI